MSTPKMPLAERLNSTDEIIVHQDGRKRRSNVSLLNSSFEERLQTLENAPNNASLANRLGSLEEWRASKAQAIPNVSTDMSNMGVTVLGLSVASMSSVQGKFTEHANAINRILSAIREREVIHA